MVKRVSPWGMIKDCFCLTVQALIWWFGNNRLNCSASHVGATKVPRVSKISWCFRTRGKVVVNYCSLFLGLAELRSLNFMFFQLELPSNLPVASYIHFWSCFSIEITLTAISQGRSSRYAGVHWHVNLQNHRAGCVSSWGGNFDDLLHATDEFMNLQLWNWSHNVTEPSNTTETLRSIVL